MSKPKTILVCPLDWGLGHASRCVPIINQFLKQGHHVIIGADQQPLAFLTKEFPTLDTIIIPGYQIAYNKKGSTLKLFCESVKFYHFIKKEKQLMDGILTNYNIDMIVSDNRYGLYSKEIKSVIITHQLYPKAPIGEKMLHQKIKKLLANFNEVWIPDFDGNQNLSGDLSHLKPLESHYKFIDPLSRFSELKSNSKKKNTSKEFDICAVISGPEPQRSIFEKLILEQLQIHQLQAVVVRGLPHNHSSREYLSTKNVLVYHHLSTQEMFKFMIKSNLIVCRSGYSSIMDLSVISKKAVLVPTPGQTEQEYLAKYHQNNEQFTIQQQDKMNLSELV